MMSINETSNFRPSVIHMGTSSPGGILTVIKSLTSRENPQLEPWKRIFIASHTDGSAPGRLWAAWKALLAIAIMMRREPLVILHCHAAMRGSFWRKSVYTSLARMLGAKTILHLHGSETEIFHANLSPVGKILFRHSLQHQDAVVVLGEHWKRFIGSQAPSANIYVIPNGVNLPNLEENIVERPPSKEIIFLGALGRRKGIYDLLPAFKELLKSHPDAKLHVCGDGELSSLKDLAVNIGVSENVSFHGHVGNADRDQIIRQCSLIVLPSYNEGLPMSLLEGMAYALTPISTNVGSIPELIIHQHNGFIIDPGDIAALSNMMKHALDNPLHTIEMGQMARKEVSERFSLAATSAAVAHLYRKLG